MRAHIRYIGVIDRAGATHSVAFGPGVNVVTGRSSTGKSALIEIFDFCFGSSDFTVPEGVITERAQTYFCVLALRNTNLVLARRREETKAFIRETNELNVSEPFKLEAGYFEPARFINLSEFKKELGRYFGIVVTNPEEDATNHEWKGGRKAGAPSVRSLTSFMLQHQNLVANKHAIFYRFDEKEKREQVIEHFKIFAGLADQAYFNKWQELHELLGEQRKLELQIPKAAEVKKRAAAEIEAALLAFLTISGQKLDLGKTDAIIRNPALALDKLRNAAVTVIPASDEHAKQKKVFEDRISSLTAELRKKHNRLAEIRSSISFATRYRDENERTPLPAGATIQASRCPFCHSDHTAIEHEANKLLGAIDWLNQELERSPYLLESFLEAEAKSQKDADALAQEILRNQLQVAIIDEQISELEKHKSQYELSLRAKYEVETILTNLQGGRDDALEKALGESKAKIAAVQHFLKSQYNMDEKLAVAQSTIREAMAEIGQHFEFEPSYRPINLEFSLSTFELWHNSPERKILLRSMGSGANWLYSHITLFLALHRYFCAQGDRCLIPSILFLDQPSQVYFPSALDTGKEFSAAELAAKEGPERKRPVDDDIVAVSNLYDQLIAFCAETQRRTGITPQVIVTDHADHLKLKNGQPFESLVQGRRWRTRGFIADKPPATELEALQLELREAMIGIYQRSLKETGVNHAFFLQMILERGAHATAVHLIHLPNPSAGYTDLYTAGRLDLTVEALVLQKKWAPLFEPETRNLARSRLEAFKFDFAKHGL